MTPWLNHQVIRSGYNDPSEYNCWKLFRATLSWRHLLAAIQLAVSCSGCTLLAAVPWNRLEHSHRKARLCVYFIWFQEVMFWVLAFLTSFSVSTIILRLRKVELIKWINLINVLFTGFVKSDIKQSFSACQDQFCVWFSLARLRAAREFFLRKKRLYLSFSC